jgi:hypothetical protein
MDHNYKEVYFDQYCVTCKHEKLKDHEDPCNECLEHPANVDSHKPVRWERGEIK